MKSILAAVALFLGFSFVFAPKALAYAELNAFYFSDSFTSATTAATTRMFIEGSIGFGIDSKKRYNVGWNYSLISAGDTAAKSATYSATMMGPRFLMFIDKNFMWSLGLGWYPLTKATNNDGTTSADWKGTGLKFDLGYNIPLSDYSYLGLRINYLSASYTEQLVGSTYSTVSYSRSLIYPSLSAIYIF